ncbi:hypothetical protein HTZ87_01500 [Mycoplasma sp. OR1901]|nr:hypothetical protein [Mycoplasma sp. OR1901]QKT05372.1 hypothetical protein HTZ87_01500 [Mycoplasma sp. OR1901]
MIKKSLFPEVYIDDWRNLFKFDDQYREQNAVILVRFSTLMFVFLFSIFKNYKNISTQKEKMKHYVFFYVAYLLLSIASVVLMFTYTYWNNYIELESGEVVTQIVPYEWNQILSLTLILIPLLLINVAFEVYNYIYKRKSEPLLYSSVTSFVIQIVSQFLLVLAVIIIAQLWANPTLIEAGTQEVTLESGEVEVKTITKPVFMFQDNATWTQIETLFTTKKPLNLFIIIILFVVFGFLILGSNIRSLSKLSEKNLLSRNNKDKFILSITLFLSMLIYLVYVAITTDINQVFNVIGDKNVYDLAYLSIIGIALVITIIYFVILSSRKNKFKSYITNTIILSITQTLLWTLLVISSALLSDKTDWNIYNIIVISTLSIAIYIHYLLKNKTLSKMTSTLIFVSIFVQTILMFIFGLNQILLSNENFVLISVPTFLPLFKLMSIFNFVIVFAFLMYIVIYSMYTLTKIEKDKKKERVSKYVKK